MDEGRKGSPSWTGQPLIAFVPVQLEPKRTCSEFGRREVTAQRKKRRGVEKSGKRVEGRKY